MADQDSGNDASAYDFGKGGVQVWECDGEGFDSPGAFCCESAREQTKCCQTDSAVFSLPGATLGNALAVQTYLGEGVDTTQLATTSRATTTKGTSVSETDDQLAKTTETTVTTETLSTGRIFRDPQTAGELGLI